MLNTVPVSLFPLTKVATWYNEYHYEIETVILPMFGHMVNMTFGPQIFINAQHCPNKFFSLTKVPSWYIKIELWLQNQIFTHIWSCGDLDFWPFDLRFYHGLKLLSEFMAPKLNFCPYLVLWWLWPLTYETKNLISSMSYHSPYFHQIQWIPFVHSGVITLTRFGWTDRQLKNTMPLAL